MTLRASLVSTSAALALLAAATCATAQQADQPATASPRQTADNTTSVETVIVTARRVAEDIQKVPATVTAVNADQIREENITTVADLATVTPSLSIATYFNDLNARFAVRGLTAGVDTYFEDAPCCGGVASAPLMDIASVQVLNGPQGTLFGRSSAAGAVLIYPKRPDLENYGGMIDVTAGDYERAQITAAVNIPIIPDHLAIRLAANANHVEGYTDLIGTSEKLDGIDNQQYRLGIEFKQDRFDNYLVFNYLNINEPATSMVLAAANPNYGLYNTTQAEGPAVFGAVCAQAVSLGLSSNVATCESQRVTTLNNIGAALAAELARQAAGGNAARSTYPSYDGQPTGNQERHWSAVNVTSYDFGKFGPLELSAKNIFSFDSYTSNSATTNDGIGGMAEEGAFANAQYSTFGANNEIGDRLTPTLGPPMLTYTEEAQLHANLYDGLLTGVIGFFYQDQTVPATSEGTTNVYKLFSGVLNPNLGYNNAVGFVENSDSTEKAWYTQFTLNLARWIHGLSLTAGYRDSWDYTTLTTLNPIINYPSGIYTPGQPPTTSSTASSGYNFTFSASEQVTDKLMIYATVARAYVPGGVNQLGQAATSLPNYTPTYGAETVLEEEIGVKADFSIAGMGGRLDVDAYNNGFNNIAETLTGLIDATSVRYNENIAGATLRGVEIQGELIPNRYWDLSFGYSYNDARYTQWTGSDPFNVAQPGDAICLPSSPAGSCYLNLTNNPFPQMPAQQAHVSLSYRLPVREELGEMKLTSLVYAQSREYYEPDAARDLQLFAGGLNGVSQAPYATLNLRADWLDIRRGGWNAAFFVTNVTNTLYATGKIPQLETLGFAVANYAPPRMFGVEVWKRFGP